MSTQITERRQEIATVQSLLDKMKNQMAMALPKHITPDRMVRVALTAVQNTPKLLECDRNSLLMAILRAAQLGLEPDGILGQAYLIPYGKQVQLIPGYKGLIDLARRTGEVTNIIAKEVYENDKFEVDYSKEIPFVHKPLLDGERGKIKFFWAMARFKDGGFHWDYMTKQEVEAIRDKGNGKNNAVWRDYFIEMGKKTVIRRIAKYLPMSVQKATITEELIDAGKKFSTDEFGEIILNNDDIHDITPEGKSGAEGLKEALKKKKAEKEADQHEASISLTPAELKAQEIMIKINKVTTREEVKAIIDNNQGHITVMPSELQNMIFAATDEREKVIGV